MSFAMKSLCNTLFSPASIINDAEAKKLFLTNKSLIKSLAWPRNIFYGDGSTHADALNDFKVRKSA